MIFKFTFKNETHSFRIKTKMNKEERYISKVELQDLFFEQIKLFEEEIIDAFFCQKNIIVELDKDRVFYASILKFIDPIEENNDSGYRTKLVIGSTELNDWIDDDIDFISALTSYIVQLQTNIFHGTAIPFDWEEIDDLEEEFVDLTTVH